MIQEPYQELLTERLILRAPTNADWRSISYLRTDAEINKYVKRSTAETKIKAISFIEKINNDLALQKIYYWSISLKGQSEMIGSICLWNFSKDRKTTELGYDLSPSYQGKGIMSEAISAIKIFALEQLKIKTILAYTHRENLKSTKLLEKNAFVKLVGNIDPDNLANVIYQWG